MTMIEIQHHRTVRNHPVPKQNYGKGDGCSVCAHFCAMNKKIKTMTHAALLAALYVVLTHLQNILVPGSATWAIQFRVSEAMCVLSFFTSAAVWGLTVGCLLFNITYAGALPLDILVGSLATFLATWAMHQLRRRPFWGLLMPALFNGILVGAELTVYIGGGFLVNAAYVAIGEAIVLLVFGNVLSRAIRRRGLDRLLA